MIVKNRWDDDVIGEFDISSGADLNGANLRGADLRGANLNGADLRGANLIGANLNKADLIGANLNCANLSGADLRRADLIGANLNSADLNGANLRGADLRGANLNGADLRVADLSIANLSRADLRGANLSGAIGTEYAIAITSILPDFGDVIGWKKCRNDTIVKLLISNGTPRSNATGRKCRAKFVTVLEVIDSEVGVSIYDENTEYRAGEIVTCHEWNEDRWTECGGGIHFFITRFEAEKYQ